MGAGVLVGYSRQRNVDAPLWMLPGHWSACEQVKGKRYSHRGEPGQLEKGFVQPALYNLLWGAWALSQGY